MKFATMVLLGILLLGSFASMQAADRTGAGEVVYGFTSVPNTLHPDNPGWCDDTLKTCVCFIYFPVVSGIEEKALFKGGVPSEANARLTWVSEFPATQTTLFNDPFTLYIVPAGPATIYYNATPVLRDPRIPTSLGEPVARFDRKAGLFVSLAPPPPGSAPPGSVDPFVSSADLVWSKTFMLDGKPFNFRNLIPHGITCHEVVSTLKGTEAGSCVATELVNNFETVAIAGPKNVTVTSREIQLDGSQSTSADGKPLTYLWTIPPGSPLAAISGGTTATPTVQFAQGRGTYTFQLTVTDSAGKSSTDLVTVNYQGN